MVEERRCSGGGEQFSVPGICPADDAGVSGRMFRYLCHVVGVLERPSRQVTLGWKWNGSHFGCVLLSREFVLLGCMRVEWLFVALSGVNVHCLSGVCTHAWGGQWWCLLGKRFMGFHRVGKYLRYFVIA